MLDSSKKIIIIGAGITGLTVAKELSDELGSRIVVLEKENYLGGLAASFTHDDILFDCGSHRLHIDANRSICDYISNLTGEPLLRKRRHGRLVYRGKAIHYPPSLFNLLSCFSCREIVSFLGGFLGQHLFNAHPTGSDFESAMIGAYGRQFYEAFFKNYAWKLWGVDPRSISAKAKRKRVIFCYKMLFRIFVTGRHHYFYPRKGTGSIAESLQKKILANGATILPSSVINAITIKDGMAEKITVADVDGKHHTMEVSDVISTIPLDDLYNMVYGNSNEHMLRWRGTRMAHVLLDKKLANPCETYYCPDSDLQIGRVSEINKYSPELNAALPGSCLTIEVPTSAKDPIWRFEDEDLLTCCVRDLQQAGILNRTTRILSAFFTRLEKVYPLYMLGWEKPFEHIFGRLNSIENLHTIGRMGLFLHCNLDHCIEQGLTMANHILAGKPGHKKQWLARTKHFLDFSARD